MTEYKKIPGTNLYIPASVTPDVIDLDVLIAQKESLSNQLNDNGPTNEELLIWAKKYHPYYMDDAIIKQQLSEIDELINILISIQ